MKKIFVTGSSGFIGSHLVEELVFNGYQVKALVPYNIDNSWGWLDNLDLSTKKNINVVMGNINDPFLLIKETKNCDVIFHLAALISIPYSYKSPSDYISTNVVGTLNVLDAAKKNDISHFIQNINA
jgi:nucleoside-diphosphate-sugar epimerase